MCPTCGTPLDMSDAPAANRIRAFIVRRINGGDTRSEIMDKLVAEFGLGVRAAPPKSGWGLLAWLLPLVAPGRRRGGARRLRVALEPLARARRHSGRARENGRAPLDPELERRLEEELARFE